MPDPAPPAFPRAWYPLCRSADVRPGQVLHLTAFGVPLAVMRTAGGQVAALRDACVHMGASLGRGRVVGEALRCPFHHWQFGPDGTCTCLPAQPQAIPQRARQAALVCAEQYGLVFAFLGGQPDYPLPRFPDGAAQQASRARRMTFDTPYQVLASNSYDVQHFPFIHHRPLVGEPQVFRQAPYHYGLTFRARVAGPSLNDRLLRLAGVHEVELTAHCYGGSLVIAGSQRTDNYIMFASLPVTADRSHIFVLNALSARRAARLPGWAFRLLLEATHLLTLNFLHADLAIVDHLKYQFGVLLPQTDAVFTGWLRYWQAQPRAVVFERPARAAVSNSILREEPYADQPDPGA